MVLGNYQLFTLMVTKESIARVTIIYQVYTYDGRGSVSSVIGGFGDYRATYWYDGLGNVIRNLYGAGDSNNRYKPYYGYNAEQYNPVTGNQNLRARQLNIRRQRFLTEDTYLGNKTDVLSINRYLYANDNPLKYKDTDGLWSFAIQSSFDYNIGSGQEISTGYVIIGNDDENGLQFANPTYSISTTTSTNIGSTAGINLTFDSRNNNIVGYSLSNSYGISGTIYVPYINIVLPMSIDVITNNDNILPVGISIGISMGDTILPWDVHSKKTENYTFPSIKNDTHVENKADDNNSRKSILNTIIDLNKKRLNGSCNKYEW